MCPVVLCLTCFTGRPAVPRLAVANRLSALRHPALSVHTAPPPADGRLLPPVTELTRVSVCTGAAVRGALGHTHTVHTPAQEDREEVTAWDQHHWGRAGWCGQTMITIIFTINVKYFFISRLKPDFWSKVKVVETRLLLFLKMSLMKCVS